MQDSHQVFTGLKHCIICIFLIHFDSAQKMLISLEYTEKYMDKFVKYQDNMILNIEKVLVKISEEQP